MNIRLTFTIIITKFLIFMLRVLKSGGTSLPGKVARKIYPDIMKIISKDFRIIMVTGTNGKTTTTRIIGKLLDENNIEYITNKSGANLVSGVITTFIESVNVFGKSKASTALLEVDEAAFNVVTDYVQPDILVVTNFFRDQLDRYGELYTTLNNVRSGIEKSPNAKLVLNADDSLCASLGHNMDREVLYYGFSDEAYTGNSTVVNSDASICLYCKSKYEYSYHVYGHLGGFSCPNCGYMRPTSKVTCVKINELNTSYSDIIFALGPLKESGEPVSYNARINLPGLYNIYNALAAASLGHLLVFSPDSLVKAMESFECGFGRMETIQTNGKTIKVILVKNPTGFNQVLSYLLTEKQNTQIAFVINDRLADGTDISWLWDVDFEQLQQMQGNVSCFYTSGIRAEDMAVRLKYAGIHSDKIQIEKDYETLLNKALDAISEGQNLYILPTYTSMLEVRSLLEKKFGLKEFWK
ncbi:MAG TPA: MurT ligase domain-containing protein [Acetivibrio sp.]|uniref:MurT ligase domain-containing protein n=1 Tax=Acetivibrio sp. TaxID=1872092 RepID=UPI002BB94C36|nr:MurT ligase domain-containing protein [Acetivibrio sp.]HOM02854.1 MurT ligase domain-containing protein [Acetivibrio sp.]